MTFDPDATIERCPHDEENPYAQISRALIRDENISPMLRWLLIYLLSNEDGWKISPRQIINHLKPQGIGRKKVYSLFNEGIEAGYIERFTVLENNLTRVNYRISEQAKFKKCFRRDPNGDAEDRHAEQGHYKKEHKKEEHKKEEIRLTSRSTPPGGKAPPPSAKALEISFFLLNKILEMKPDIRKPRIEKWEKTIDRMIRLDKKDPGKIEEVIEWVFTDEFWSINILSADKLRKQFDRLELQMTQKALKDPQKRIKDVQQYIMTHPKREALKTAANKNKIEIGPKYMEIIGYRGGDGYISFENTRAKYLIDHWIKKMNL